MSAQPPPCPAARAVLGNNALLGRLEGWALCPPFLLAVRAGRCAALAPGVSDVTSERERILALGRPVASDLGLELLDVELAGAGPRRLIRVILDRPGGAVKVGDCEAVSRRLGDVLEAQGVVQGRYMLEVSSPGLNRRLITPEHFRAAVGSRVRLRMAASGEGGRTLLGRLESLDGEMLTVTTDTKEIRTMGLGEIEKANIEYEFPSKERRPTRRR